MTTGVASWAWSYSHLKNFETCPKRYAHYQVLKDVTEPETDQLREGNDLHAAFEHRVKSGTPLPLAYARFEPMLERILAAPGRTYGEQKLALTSSFAPTGWFAKTAWFRTIGDLLKETDEQATIIDWKTGAVKEDLTQLQLLALTVFAHKPKLKRVKAALVFVNHEHVAPAEFVPEQVTVLWGEILPRVRAMMNARATSSFPPNPSGLCKKYCAVTACPHHGVGNR